VTIAVVPVGFFGGYFGNGGVVRLIVSNDLPSSGGDVHFFLFFANIFRAALGYSAADSGKRLFVETAHRIELPSSID